jgi:hypothetical protein
MHRGETKAGIHAPTIDMHSAGTALTVITSFFGSGQMQVFAQTIEKSGARIDPQIVLLSVNAKRDRDGILRFN